MHVKLLIVILIVFPLYAIGQRVIGDCTIKYDVTIKDEANEISSKAHKVLYLRGKQVRADFEDPNYSQTIIIDGNKGNATILKTVGNNKVAMLMDSTDWKRQNEVYGAVQYQMEEDDSKIILGYHCTKATAQIPEVGNVTIYFTSKLQPTINENCYLYKNIPGIVLQYEAKDKKNNTITSYLATSVNLMPVLYNFFNPDLKGYRIITDIRSDN